MLAYSQTAREETFQESKGIMTGSLQDPMLNSPTSGDQSMDIMATCSIRTPSVNFPTCQLAVSCGPLPEAGVCRCFFRKRKQNDNENDTPIWDHGSDETGVLCLQRDPGAPKHQQGDSLCMLHLHNDVCTCALTE